MAIREVSKSIKWRGNVQLLISFRNSGLSNQMEVSFFWVFSTCNHCRSLAEIPGFLSDLGLMSSLVTSAMVTRRSAINFDFPRKFQMSRTLGVLNSVGPQLNARAQHSLKPSF